MDKGKWHDLCLICYDLNRGRFQKKKNEKIFRSQNLKFLVFPTCLARFTMKITNSPRTALLLCVVAAVVVFTAVHLPPKLGECTLDLPSATLYYTLLHSIPIYYPLFSSTTLYNDPLTVCTVGRSGSPTVKRNIRNLSRRPIDIIIYYNTAVLVLACTWGRRRGPSSKVSRYDASSSPERRPAGGGGATSGDRVLTPKSIRYYIMVSESVSRYRTRHRFRIEHNAPTTTPLNVWPVYRDIVIITYRI